MLCVIHPIYIDIYNKDFVFIIFIQKGCTTPGMSGTCAFPKLQILDSSKLKEFANNNFKFDENGKNLSERVENIAGKGEITSNFSFSHSVFERLVLQTCKTWGLFGKGLTLYQTTTS